MNLVKTIVDTTQSYIKQTTLFTDTEAVKSRPNNIINWCLIFAMKIHTYIYGKAQKNLQQIIGGKQALISRDKHSQESSDSHTNYAYEKMPIS